jgi:hypothetical protein
MDRKIIKGIFTKQMDIKAVDPIIESKELPAMKADVATEVKLDTAAAVRGSLMEHAFKGAEFISIPVAGAAQQQAFNAAAKPTVDPAKNLADQVAMPVAQEVSVTGSYVVLRMRVQNGELSVIGSKKVDSPLVVNENIVQGGLAYEVFVDNARVVIGSIPDFGEQRSFARPGTHEHFITQLPSFDFNLRVPSDKVSLEHLPKLNISLYKFKEQVPDLQLTALPLHQQFTKEVRVVAQMQGIQVANLHPEVKELVTKSFIIK